jgi:hypothetical protein
MAIPLTGGKMVSVGSRQGERLRGGSDMVASLSGSAVRSLDLGQVACFAFAATCSACLPSALPLMTEPAKPSPPAECPALPDALRKEIPRAGTLRFADPLRWLRAGLRDAWAHPGIAAFYGACFWLMAYLLGVVFRNKPEYTMSLTSGCLLVGPFLAMGLYDVSRQREQGGQPELSRSITCWDQHLGSMGMLVLVLIVLELLWGRASLVVFAVFFNTGMA